MKKLIFILLIANNLQSSDPDPYAREESKDSEENKRLNTALTYYSKSSFQYVIDPLGVASLVENCDREENKSIFPTLSYYHVSLIMAFLSPNDRAILRQLTGSISYYECDLMKTVTGGIWYDTNFEIRKNLTQAEEQRCLKMNTLFAYVVFGDDSYHVFRRTNSSAAAIEDLASRSLYTDGDLQVLRLHNLSLSLADFNHILKRTPTTLTCLDLSGNDLSHIHIFVAKLVNQNRGLKSLNLSKSSLGFHSLSQACKYAPATLTSLDLSDNDLSVKHLGFRFDALADNNNPFYILFRNATFLQKLILVNCHITETDWLNDRMKAICVFNTHD